jgi:hypothetical protein
MNQGRHYGAVAVVVVVEVVVVAGAGVCKISQIAITLFSWSTVI